MIVYKVVRRDLSSLFAEGPCAVTYKVGEAVSSEVGPVMAFDNIRQGQKWQGRRRHYWFGARLFRAEAVVHPSQKEWDGALLHVPCPFSRTDYFREWWQRLESRIGESYMNAPDGTVLCQSITLLQEIK